ncbi:MAG: c-type cytochrome [Planctomycetota bacterium]
MTGLRKFLLAVLAVSLALVALAMASRGDVRKRNWEIFTEMVYSKANESFSASPDLPHGMTEQPLVPGVIPRDWNPFPYGKGPDEAERAGEELESPFEEDDQEAAQEGEQIFRTYCVVCHDLSGEGHGTVVQKGMVPPPSLLNTRAVLMEDGQMFHILTRGQGNLASYAPQLSPEERWKVILFVRTLQEEAE